MSPWTHAQKAGCEEPALSVEKQKVWPTGSVSTGRASNKAHGMSAAVKD